MKVIQTKYNGYKFRSRLEARWAVFFDAIGIKYLYEPEGFEFINGEMYLPDFYLPDFRYWIEIKGQMPTDEEQKLAQYLCENKEESVFICWGNIGNHVFYEDLNNDGFYAYIPLPKFKDDPWAGGSYWDNMHMWCKCPICGKIGIQFEGRANRLCECQLGSKYRTPEADTFISAYELARSARFEHGESPTTRV